MSLLDIKFADVKQKRRLMQKVDCWDTWSRCSRWSIAGSGRIWPTFDAHCKQSRYKGGKCVDVKSKCPISSKALQCQCY
ncbi:hypothetical protein DPMN_167557 [Dreissena polymorpha]|uniref:Uncharacterized protein n=1 Tax=Dreissena polymorpha TaxID=45954 RepID=A0A9D4IYG7_DREPO|nr:hypothetical protein DPMN_167557 [Dreissena polymorpha]